MALQKCLDCTGTISISYIDTADKYLLGLATSDKPSHTALTVITREQATHFIEELTEVAN